MKLIDKDALVAEIEKCYNECLKRAKITDSDYWNAKADAYRNVLVSLDNTLEVKEVDFEKEYVCKDAFIKKACEWLNNNVEKYYYLDEAYDKVISTKNLNNDFKKYMED